MCENKKIGKFGEKRYNLYEYIFVLPYNFIRMILCSFSTWLQDHTYLGMVIASISMIFSFMTFWFLLENRFSSIKTEYNSIPKTFKVGGVDTFIGHTVEFVLINNTNTLSIIKNQPTVHLKYQYGF